MLSKLFGRTNKKNKQDKTATSNKVTKSNLSIVRCIHSKDAVKQIKPNAYCHFGQHKAVTVCSKCNRTAMASAQSDLKPCPDCGGKVLRGTGRHVDELEKFVAKWEHNQWVFAPSSPLPPYLDRSKKWNFYL